MTGEAASEAERERIAAAERLGYPYLVYRDQHGHRQVVSLEDSWERLTVGRGAAVDLALVWDSEVSKVHAELVRLGEDWVLVDEGLSRNGSFVNGERVEGRWRLVDGDAVRFGETEMEFNAPFQSRDRTTIGGVPPPEAGTTGEPGG